MHHHSRPERPAGRGSASRPVHRGEGTVTGRRDGTTFRRGADVARQAETDALNGRLRARLVTCCVPQPCRYLGPTGIMAVQDLKGGVAMAVLAGRVAVVTGASAGIGAGLAAMLAAEGAKVVLAARREGNWPG